MNNINWSVPELRKGRFYNPHVQDIKRNLLDVCRWRLGHYDEKPGRLPPPEGFQYPVLPPAADQNKPSAIWLGHSTYLVQVGGVRFLTDPVFSEYCSPVPISVLRRYHQPAISLDALPEIDCVLLSHNHYDHLDKQSVLALVKQKSHVTWVVPTGVKRWFIQQGIQNVVELYWGESHQLKEDCKITAVPAQHFSGRGLLDKNKTLWCGYVVEYKGKTFYFVGDTGYNSVDFKQIGQIWPQIDLSLIPIGAYVPKTFMQPVHISPEEAVQIHCDVGSRLSIGMHWKTFHLSDEPRNQPPYDLFLAMQAKNLALESFLPIEPGVYLNW